MTRILQFRDYEETTTFVLGKYNEEIVSTIKRIKEITRQYPYEIYFDFEVNNIIEPIGFAEDLKEWINSFTWTYDSEDEENYELYKNIKIIKNYYKF